MYRVWAVSYCFNGQMHSRSILEIGCVLETRSAVVVLVVIRRENEHVCVLLSGILLEAEECALNFTCRLRSRLTPIVKHVSIAVEICQLQHVLKNDKFLPTPTRVVCSFADL